MNVPTTGQAEPGRRRSVIARVGARYFNSWFYPSTVFLVLVAFAAGAMLLTGAPTLHLADGLIILAALAFLGILAAAIWNLVKKRWVKGTINLVLFPVCAILSVALMYVVTFASMFGPSEDSFADNLTIPDDIEISEPLPENTPATSVLKDPFQDALMAALSLPGGDDPTVRAEITSLARLQREHPDILRRYLAASPAWRVYQERGGIFATRRWTVNGLRRYSLHGYYGAFDFRNERVTDTESFQTRTTIDLTGRSWIRGNRSETELQAGQSIPLHLTEGNLLQESNCIISADKPVLEIFEQSTARERRLTKAAITFLEREFKPLVDSPGWETSKQLLPPDAISTEPPGIELHNSFQPGIYNATIRVNPGEPGMVFLKAFEVTKGTRLSVDRLKERSNEWIGWSANPAECFLANSNFTIYEGDWGKPYAARFEVWFQPDSKSPEHKLLERVFKIEGWMR